MVLGLERGTIQLTLDSPMKGHGRDACVPSMWMTLSTITAAARCVRIWFPRQLSKPGARAEGAVLFECSHPGQRRSQFGPVAAAKNCGVACARVPDGADRLNRYRRAAGRHEGYAARVAQRANDGRAEDRWTDTEQLSVGANDHVRRRF